MFRLYKDTFSHPRMTSLLLLLYRKLMDLYVCAGRSTTHDSCIKSLGVCVHCQTCKSAQRCPHQSPGKSPAQRQQALTLQTEIATGEHFHFTPGSLILYAVSGSRVHLQFPMQHKVCPAFVA